MNYRKKLQESLDESGDGYALKTNSELINMIKDFGCGETEFHTADIERLIKENKKMVSVISNLVNALYDTDLGIFERKNAAIELGQLAIDLYK
jgi:hypothetical protein